MWATLTLSRTMSTGPNRTYPIKTPQTRHSSHQGNFTKAFYFIYLHDHSFIISHTHVHTFIYARIHLFIPCIQSIAYAVDASQRFVLRHKAVVASFDMSDDRLGFEGQLTKGSRLPRVKQS